MGNWNTSRRRQQLPADWPAIRKLVLTRDQHRCRIQGPRCTSRATDVDHIHGADDHSPGNLQAACAPCHAAKSSAEGHAAQGHGPGRYRPPEPHPGLRRP